MLLLTSECKSAPAQYTNIVIIIAPLQSLPRKQIKMILTLCKPLLIVNVRVKDLFKVTMEYKNEEPLLEKWAWHIHNEIL